MFISRSWLTLGAAAMGFTCGSVAIAQQPASASAQDTERSGVLEEVTVTARKREERLLDVPLSISAFTAKDIEEKGFKNLEDVTRAAPGVQYSQQGGQIPGRFTSAIRFRGMNVNSDSPSLQLGALFVDGIYSLGGTQSIPYDDVERIEVVKGPQSATYGRSTFGGAINYITRTPSLSKYSGSLNVTAAKFSENDISAAFEGPIVEDKLSFRIGGRYYNRGKLFTASDGGGLGEESSKSIQGTLFFNPVDALKIKLRGFYDVDDDGPSTGGIVQGIRNDSCTGKTIQTQDPKVPVANPMLYVCGAVPTISQAISATGGSVIDTPTSLRPAQAGLIGLPNYLIDNLVNRPYPTAVSSAPRIDHIGLIRNVFRASISADYELPAEYTLTLQGGYNRLRASWIRDFGLTPLGYWWSRDPTDSKDKSYEIRLSSPQKQRFTWLAGANYYEQDFIQSGSGGDAVNICWPKAGAPVRAAGAPCVAANTTGILFPNTLAQNSDHVSTVGIFAAASYNITDQWTASLEGRQQKDASTSGVLTTTPRQIVEKKFLPRAILRWQPNRGTNVYASFSRGILPGIVNTQLVIATPREFAQYQVAQPGVPSIIAGDQLKMYEIGWKQQFWNNRASTSIAIYKGDWINQKGRSVAAIQEDCGSASHGAGNAASGCPSGATGLPAVVAGQPFLNFRNFNVPGSTTLSGLEFEGAFAITDRWDIRPTFTYAKTEYKDFTFNFLSAISQFTQMRGNQNARFPKVSGSLASSYKAPLRQDWTWYLNGDVSYVGKTFTDESNLGFCKAYFLTNARVGFEKGDLRVEGFVKNALNDKNYAACARWSDFDTPGTVNTAFQGVAVTPQNPRQIGIRASIKF